MTLNQIDYWPSGEIRREYFLVDNKLHGNDTWYYENGIVELTETFVNGKREGKHISYYDDGQIQSECTYVNDKKNGQDLSYYENGKMSCNYNWLNGKRHGKCKWFFKTGQLDYFDTFDNGTRHGESIFYTLEKTGEYFLVRKVNYTYGDCLYVGNKLVKGDKFICEVNQEKKYYKVSRGNITHNVFGTEKSTNFQVTQLKFKHDSTHLVPDDDHSKVFHNVDKYELVEDGLPHKFMTFSQNYRILPFLEGTCFIEWKTKEERSEKIRKIKNII